LNNRLSDVVIAISPAARDNLTDTGTNPDKIITMFNGVDPVRKLSDDEKSSTRASLGIPDEQFVCAIIARLVPEKGHACVLDAADLLRDLPICIIIAGSGPIESELRAAADARGLSNCLFTGFVSDIAVIENITDLQLNASYGTETSCLSVLEGMSLSTPAVVSDYGGNPYLVKDGENGLVVPMHDAAALASAIRKLYSDPELLVKMGNSALAAYNERFTSKRMTADIEQAYRTAISLKSGRKE
jgi:glycosyltransferase involved in cell wall biosynthesis